MITEQTEQSQIYNLNKVWLYYSPLAERLPVHLYMYHNKAYTNTWL